MARTVPSFEDHVIRYSAVPMQMRPVVRYDPRANERTLDLLRWGVAAAFSC